MLKLVKFMFIPDGGIYGRAS